MKRIVFVNLEEGNGSVPFQLIGWDSKAGQITPAIEQAIQLLDAAKFDVPEELVSGAVATHKAYIPGLGAAIWYAGHPHYGDGVTYRLGKGDWGETT